MKERLGFVSNSSSSSFVLVFDILPETVEDLIGLLNFDSASNQFSHEQYAQRILDDIEPSATDADDEELKDLLRDIVYSQGMFFERYCKAFDHKDPVERKQLIQELDAVVDGLAVSELEKFKKKNSGKHVRVVTYSDEDGMLDSTIEHGNMFDNIEHLYISHH